MSLTYDVMEKVNAEVNAAVAYTPDPEKYSSADWWEDALDEGNQGDCEDYAIAKLRRLIALGWKREELKLGLCKVETGEYHAVLVVTCDGQDWVLDNRHPFPTRWEDLPYKWDKFYMFGERKWRTA